MTNGRKGQSTSRRAEILKALAPVVTGVLGVVVGRAWDRYLPPAPPVPPVAPAATLPRHIEGNWQAIGADAKVAELGWESDYTYDMALELRDDGKGGVLAKGRSQYGRVRNGSKPEEGFDRIEGHGTVQGNHVRLIYDLHGDTTKAEGGGVMNFEFPPSGTQATGSFIARHVNSDHMAFGFFCLARSTDKEGIEKCRRRGSGDANGGEGYSGHWKGKGHDLDLSDGKSVHLGASYAYELDVNILQNGSGLKVQGKSKVVSGEEGELPEAELDARGQVQPNGGATLTYVQWHPGYQNYGTLLVSFSLEGTAEAYYVGRRPGGKDSLVPVVGYVTMKRER